MYAQAVKLFKESVGQAAPYMLKGSVGQQYLETIYGAVFLLDNEDYIISLSDGVNEFERVFFVNLSVYPLNGESFGPGNAYFVNDKVILEMKDLGISSFPKVLGSNDSINAFIELLNNNCSKLDKFNTGLVLEALGKRLGVEEVMPDFLEFKLV